MLNCTLVAQLLVFPVLTLITFLFRLFKQVMFIYEMCPFKTVACLMLHVYSNVAQVFSAYYLIYAVLYLEQFIYLLNG